MHIWKTIRQLRDCTPVPLDMALKALRPDNPREFILRLYNKGWLLGEFYPSQLLLDMVNHTLEARKAGVIKDAVPLHPPEKELCPLESVPNLSDPATWERIYILREELLALRVPFRYEQWRKRRTSRKRATIASAPPAATPPPAADHQPGQREARKGGRPPSQLYLGIEALYLKKLAAGETALLQPQAGPAFMEELRRAVNGPEVCENVKVYIPKLERRGGRYRVYVADPPEIDGRPPRSNEKPNGYTAADVSKKMNKLREKYPLE